MASFKDRVRSAQFRTAGAWPTETEFVQQVAGRLPWTFVQVLFERLVTREERNWYAGRAAECSGSRNVLERQIAFVLRGAIKTASTFRRGTPPVGRRVLLAHPSAASPVAIADYCAFPDDAPATLPGAKELQAVITDEIARTES